MSGNQRVRRSAKPKDDALDLQGEALTPESVKKHAKALEKQLRRLEVELVATQRITLEEQLHGRNYLPPPDMEASRARPLERLPLAQLAELKKMVFYKFLEWLFTAVILAGASAWLYKWYLMKVGG